MIFFISLFFKNKYSLLYLSLYLRSKIYNPFLKQLKMLNYVKPTELCMNFTTYIKLSVFATIGLLAHIEWIYWK